MSLSLNEPVQHALHSNPHTTSKHEPETYWWKVGIDSLPNMVDVISKTTNYPQKISSEKKNSCHTDTWYTRILQCIWRDPSVEFRELTFTSAGVILIIPPTKSGWGLVGSELWDAASWPPTLEPNSDMTKLASGASAIFPWWLGVEVGEGAVESWLDCPTSIGISVEGISSNFPSKRLPETGYIKYGGE